MYKKELKLRTTYIWEEKKGGGKKLSYYKQSQREINQLRTLAQTYDKNLWEESSSIDFFEDYWK